MASTYSTSLRLELIGTGDQSGTWGTTTNTNLGTLLEQAITGVSNVSMSSDADYTLTTVNGGVDQARQAVLNITSSVSLTATRNIIVPSVNKIYIVKNGTTGSQSLVIKTSAGTGITVTNGSTTAVYCDGTNVYQAIDYLTSLTTPTLVGGTGASSSLTLKSTSGVGTSDAISFKVGNNGATTAMYINTSGQVGIGTTSPSGFKLNVSDGTTNFVINPSSSVGYAGTQNNYPVALLTNNIERMRIDTSGNVGIGTTSPGVKLDVSGTGTTFRLTSSNTDSSMAFANSNGGTSTYIGNSGTNAFYVSTNGSERMRIDSSGRVGIGTNSPAFALDVAGNNGAAIRGGNGFNLYNSDNTNNFYLYNIGATGAANAALVIYQGGVAERMRIDSNGNLLVNRTTVSGLAGTSGHIVLNDSIPNGTLAIGGFGSYLGRQASDGSTVLATGQGSIIFGSGGYGSTIERMRIDSSGNVGIGTSSPAAILHTSRSSAAGYVGNYFDNTATNGYVRLDLRIGSSGGNGVATIKYAPGTFMQIGPDSNDTTTPLVFATNNATERARIDASGNLLVGTTSTSSSGFNGAQIQPFGNAALNVSRNDVAANGSAAVITTYTNFSTTQEKFVVRANGDVQNRTGSYTAYSDERLKENITDARSYLSDLTKLRVVNYNFKADTIKNKYLGFVAQEVEKVMPGLVFETDTDGISDCKGIKLTVMIPMLVQAIQELKAELDALKGTK